MASTEQDITTIKVDVGVLKTQIDLITKLCGKMDDVIEKLVQQHDRHLAKVYTDMEDRRRETDADVKEIHGRIDIVLDKVQQVELRLVEEIKSLRVDMQSRGVEEKEILDKLLKWKWMIVGGIIVVTWLISHVGPDTLATLMK
jgi:hypothetical protein